MQRATRDILYFETGPDNAPTLRVQPGETFEIETQINRGPWLDDHPDGERLRQKLIALEDETNWNAAVRQLQELHQDLWGEALWIPLFEVDDFLVVRKNIRGLAEAPVHPYHGVEEWIVDPWYPTETP